jgi:hypothetical protein
MNGLISAIGVDNALRLQASAGLGFLTDPVAGSNSFSALLDSVNATVSASATSASGGFGLGSVNIAGWMFSGVESVSAVDPIQAIISAGEAVIGRSGPLPTFLRSVVAGRNLNAAQTQSLYAITLRNMDIVKTPDSVMALARELQAAGI